MMPAKRPRGRPPLPEGERKPRYVPRNTLLAKFRRELREFRREHPEIGLTPQETKAIRRDAPSCGSASA